MGNVSDTVNANKDLQLIADKLLSLSEGSVDEIKIDSLQNFFEKIADTINNASKKLKNSLKNLEKLVQRYRILFANRKKKLSFLRNIFNFSILLKKTLLIQASVFTKLKSIKFVYQKIKYSNHLITIFPKLQSINYIKA